MAKTRHVSRKVEDIQIGDFVDYAGTVVKTHRANEHVTLTFREGSEGRFMDGTRLNITETEFASDHNTAM